VGQHRHVAAQRIQGAGEVKPTKKKRPEFPKSAVSGRKPGLKRPAVADDRAPKDKWKKATAVYIGGDISLTSISLGGLSTTTDGKLRVGAISRRWTRDVDYFVRLKEAAMAHELVLDLLAELKVLAEMTEISFAIEEAVPIGMLQRSSKGQKQGAAGAWMKQQIQISGAFLGGLVRWGYNDIAEIQSNQWRSMVAHDLGITTHASKWNSDEFLALPDGFHASPKNVGKFRARQWVVQFHPKWDGKWPDIISSKDGQVPRPSTSKAAGIQSDDRYEALAMAEWLRRDVKSRV
jgi:hypothetical protein